MKTNIKMRVTPEQSEKVQQICFNNGIQWSRSCFNKSNLDKPYIYIYNKEICYGIKKSFFIRHLNEEIDADLFIRTNGTCEENELKNFIQSQNENIDITNAWLNEFNNISLKLKKKNEILKKARIKRKNQREELHKLNLKLQKCIDLEAHNIATQKLRDTIVSLRDEVIIKVDNMTYTKNKEIEKLKVVIEYLESKAK